jgi:hypothetical protein
VVASLPAIEEWAKREGIEFEDVASLCNKEEMQKEIIVSLQKVCCFLMEMHGSFDFYFCLNLKIAKFQKISPNFTQ